MVHCKMTLDNFALKKVIGRPSPAPGCWGNPVGTEPKLASKTSNSLVLKYQLNRSFLFVYVCLLNLDFLHIFLGITSKKSVLLLVVA